jgi:hypothetical protein
MKFYDEIFTTKQFNYSHRYRLLKNEQSINPFSFLKLFKKVMVLNFLCMVLKQNFKNSKKLWWAYPSFGTFFKINW